MNNQLVSIIIPTYNRSNLLSKAISSVINQTYKMWELIIVDDGSYDNTKEVVQEFIRKDARIKYFYQENKGQASALNRGLEESSGYFIAFLDDDDEWFPNKLEKQIELLKINPNLSMVYSDALICGGKLDGLLSSQISKKYQGCVYKYLLKENFITASTVLIKKDVLLKVGFFDDKNFYIKKTQTQDYDLWLRIARYYQIGYIPEPLVKYNYIPKVTTYKKRNEYYKALLYIYFKNLKLAKSIDESFILISNLTLYFLKLNFTYIFKNLAP